MLLSVSSDDFSAELAREQAYVTTLYAKLDAERVDAQRRLDETLQLAGGTPQARTERDVATTLYTDRLAQLGSVEQGLAFGRLDFVPESAEETTYIGRLGLFDEDDDYRAAAGRLAGARRAALLPRHRGFTRRGAPTAAPAVADPQGHRLRRRGPRPRPPPTRARTAGLAGEAALLAALDARRTGRMSDIVATIQAEQDRDHPRPSSAACWSSRAAPAPARPPSRCTAPPTCSTRTASSSTTRGVLVVGPNSTFLRYIGQVLPSLGETGVLLATVGAALPGPGRRRRRAARGRPRSRAGSSMAEVLAKAVRDRQRVPRAGAWRSSTSATCCGWTARPAPTPGPAPAVRGGRTTRRGACSSPTSSTR